MRVVFDEAAPADTGLPMAVWITENDGYPHNVRVKVSKLYGGAGSWRQTLPQGGGGSDPGSGGGGQSGGMGNPEGGGDEGTVTPGAGIIMKKTAAGKQP